MRKLITSTVAATLLAFSSIALSAQSAQAATCGGTLKDRKYLYDSAQRYIGYVSIYRSGSTYVCASVNHAGDSYGIYAETAVVLSNGSGHVLDTESGSYRYSIWEDVSGTAANQCIEARGGIVWKGQTYAVDVDFTCG